METLTTPPNEQTSIRPPAELVDRGYIAIGRTRQQLAREIFNLRAIDIAFDHDSVDSFLGCIELKELEVDTTVMSTQQHYRELLAAFLANSISIFRTKY